MLLILNNIKRLKGCSITRPFIIPLFLIALLSVFSALTPGLAYAVDTVPVAKFSQQDLSNWQTKSFKGNTTYQLVKADNQVVLQAISKSSASGLAKKIRIDLTKTPFINWRWKTANHLDITDETSKRGDDYVARVYVILDGGWRIWKTKALNYVWSSHQKKSTLWNNAFAGNKAKMLAVNDNESPLNQWITHKRNVHQDLIHAFSKQGIHPDELRYIDAIAIMTDTDNSNGTATAWYGDIYFTAN